ncbi:MAG: hydroxysqualene dehydroxylase HpnE [Gemmatimonadota bacterium]|nr:hydroxysqualene dehydroxylase HpnE [Gemmatimonadota bacterium]
MNDVIVIGGGLAGLAGAVALADAGLKVTLYERRAILGGRASSFVHPAGGELVDNCQHVLLRCCANLIDFYTRLGVENGIVFQDRVPFIDEANRISVIQSSPLPVPLHLLPSFFRLKFLGWKDKLSVSYAMMHMIWQTSKWSGGQEGKKPPTPAHLPLSMQNWLKSHRATDRSIEALWRPILISALNDELDDIDAEYGIMTIVKAFLSNRQSYQVGLPVVPLGDLYAPCIDYLEQRGGRVILDQGITEMAVDNTRITRMTLQDGTTVQADAYLSALPFDILLKMLPDTEVTRWDYFNNLQRLDFSPITAVHVWLDRPVMDLDFVAVLGRTIQWIFNQTIRDPDAFSSTESGTYLGLVVSASDEWMKQPQQVIIQQALEDLKSIFPAVQEAKLLKAIVVKEGRATFAPEPGCDPLRPGPVSPISNLFVAGDWTQTGWPATMESAVRSGYQSAEAMLSVFDKPQKVLLPEVPVEGIMKLVMGDF